MRTTGEAATTRAAIPAHAPTQGQPSACARSPRLQLVVGGRHGVADQGDRSDGVCLGATAPQTRNFW